MEAPKAAERVMVTCGSCGTTNYYPLNAGGKKAACGRCRAILPLPGTVLEPGQQEAYNVLRNSRLPVLVDFYSQTCGPCHVMHPVLERLAKRRAGEIVVIKIDVDRLPELASGFGIQAVPTFVIALGGTERARTSGAVSEENFSLWVASRT